jgi:hypothetical protein
MTDVDVRVVDLHADDAALLRAEATLAPEELVRARRGVPAVHRRRVLLRGALRAALADALGIEPAAVPPGVPTSPHRGTVPPWTSAVPEAVRSVSSRSAAAAGWGSTWSRSRRGRPTCSTSAG